MATAAPARLNPIGARKNKTTTSTEEKEKKKVPERKRSRSPIKKRSGKPKPGSKIWSNYTPGALEAKWAKDYDKDPNAYATLHVKEKINAKNEVSQVFYITKRKTTRLSSRWTSDNKDKKEAIFFPEQHWGITLAAADFLEKQLEAKAKIYQNVIDLFESAKEILDKREPYFATKSMLEVLGHGNMPEKIPPVVPTAPRKPTEIYGDWDKILAFYSILRMTRKYSAEQEERNDNGKVDLLDKVKGEYEFPELGIETMVQKKNKKESKK